VTFLEVSNEIFIIGIALVSSYPASHGYFQPSLLYEHFNILLHLWRLSLKPHAEEFHLHVSEDLIGILKQLKNHGTDNLVYFSVINVVILSCEIIIVCFQPSYIIMSVGN